MAGAAKEIELLLYSRETTSDTLYRARVRYPIDTWRKLLGPEDFVLLEGVENAFWRLEKLGPPSQLFSFSDDGRDVLDLDSAQKRAVFEEKSSAIKAFANRSRNMQSEAYNEVVITEDARKLRAAYWRHPVKTWKRERHNKRVRAANPWPDGTPAGQ